MIPFNTSTDVDTVIVFQALQKEAERFGLKLIVDEENSTFEVYDVVESTDSPVIDSDSLNLIQGFIAGFGYRTQETTKE
jgi:hypothetical protein